MNIGVQSGLRLLSCKKLIILTVCFSLPLKDCFFIIKFYSWAQEWNSICLEVRIKPNENPFSNQINHFRSNNVRYGFTVSVSFTKSSTSPPGVSKGPYGIVSVRELLRCLVQLCDSHNKNNSESMIHIGLTLLTTAMEVGAEAIEQFPSLMAIVKDDLCRYLIGVSDVSFDTLL